MATAKAVHRRHDGHVTAVVNEYKDELQKIVTKASRRTINRLRDMVTLDRGRIEPTAGNQRALRQTSKIFREEMNQAGFDAATDGFVRTFQNHLPMFQDTLKMISENLKTPLPPIRFGPVSQNLSSQQISATKILRGAVDQAGKRAEQRAILAVGGVSFDDLSEIMADSFHKSIGEAEGLAATSLSAYWRTIASHGFSSIEDSLKPGQSLYYRYVGPKDKLNRPFCADHWNKTYTRDEIDSMDNTQTPVGSVMQLCGGFRCRHAFIVDRIGPTKH